jgi:hypothetical protein
MLRFAAALGEPKTSLDRGHIVPCRGRQRLDIKVTLGQVRLRRSEKMENIEIETNNEAEKIEDRDEANKVEAEKKAVTIRIKTGVRGGGLSPWAL